MPPEIIWAHDTEPIAPWSVTGETPGTAITITVPQSRTDDALPAAILAGLGKPRNALRTERARQHAWPITDAWLHGHQIETIVLLAAHRLNPSDFHTLTQHSGPAETVALIFPTPPDHATRRSLHLGTATATSRVAHRARRLRQHRADRCTRIKELPLPDSSFLTFRADARRYLPPPLYETVNQHYLNGYRSVAERLATHATGWDLPLDITTTDINEILDNLAADNPGHDHPPNPTQGRTGRLLPATNAAPTPRTATAPLHRSHPRRRRPGTTYRHRHPRHRGRSHLDRRHRRTRSHPSQPVPHRLPTTRWALHYPSRRTDRNPTHRHGSHRGTRRLPHRVRSQLHRPPLHNPLGHHGHPGDESEDSSVEPNGIASVTVLHPGYTDADPLPRASRPASRRTTPHRTPMASLVARRIHLGVTTWAIERETGLNRHTVDRVLGDPTQLEALPLRIATRLAHILGLPTADQLTTPTTSQDTIEDGTATHTDAPRIVAALHAWGGWVEPAEITHVLELHTDRTEAALDYIPSLLTGTGTTVLTSPQLGVRLAPDPDHLNETLLDDIARLRIRTREPSYTTASVISEAMLTGDIRLYPHNATFDLMQRLGYIRRGHIRYGVHPDIDYSISDAASEVRRVRKRGRGGAASPDNPRPEGRDEQ